MWTEGLATSLRTRPIARIEVVARYT
jgi:hypothetical protein